MRETGGGGEIEDRETERGREKQRERERGHNEETIRKVSNIDTALVGLRKYV